MAAVAAILFALKYFVKVRRYSSLMHLHPGEIFRKIQNLWLERLEFLLLNHSECLTAGVRSCSKKIISLPIILILDGMAGLVENLQNPEYIYTKKKLIVKMGFPIFLKAM